ncbi:MAG: lytic polysaccharide monooxygenase auxiliary activity family 9 protein [Acidobacteriota bacterium]
MPVLTSSVVARCCLLNALLLIAPSVVLGHGSMQTPPSRVFQCRFADNPENPENAACAAAVDAAGSSQFLYDWNGIRQGAAAGQHQAVVPDGELCSGGGDEYAGLDLARDDWQATEISSAADGTFEFVYLATAPHSTQDMLFFVTPQGWDPASPLTWEALDFVDQPGEADDPMDPFCRLTSVELETFEGVGDVYRMSCPLPARTGRHVIYHVWQRNDSPEAFYACIDVIFGEGGALFRDGFESGDVSGWEPMP